MSEFNIKYMEKALELAREAFQDDEVPVGAVIVHNGEITLIFRMCISVLTISKTVLAAL